MNDERNRTTPTTGAGTLDTEHHDANRDPLSGEPGAHPVGTGVGAATGGTVGAVIGGAVGGPVGAVIGAAVGGLAGGLAGKGISESVNPTEEDAYWRDSYSTRPYAQGRTYDEYRPAYQYGWESRGRYADRNWNDAESDLERGWHEAKGKSSLAWNEAKNATRDAWDRVENRLRENRTSEGTTSTAASYGATAANTGDFGTTSTSGSTSGFSSATSSSTGSTHMGSGLGSGSWSDQDDSYWRENYLTRPYARSGYSYDDYRPAYQYGTDSVHRYQGREWNDVENDLERGWEHAKGKSRLAWHEIKDAVRDAWNRTFHSTHEPAYSGSSSDPYRR